MRRGLGRGVHGGTDHVFCSPDVVTVFPAPDRVIGDLHTYWSGSVGRSTEPPRGDSCQARQDRQEQEKSKNSFTAIIIYHTRKYFGIILSSI